jgi:SAM-dependent methyltransferase
MSGPAWFKIDGREGGERTLEEQLKGLAPALEGAKGKRILDLGSAEGLISREFARAGAEHVLGVEIMAEHVEVARELCAGLPCQFIQGDIAQLEVPTGGWDIVLLLAVLHKTREPERILADLASAARELVVIRMPGGAKGGRYSHHRPGNELVDVALVLQRCGFVLERTERGPTKDCGLEPVLYFRRRA